MKIHDLSLPIFPGMVVWPDSLQVAFNRSADMERGDAVTVSELSLGAHTGTHLDAPLHFVRGGAGVDSLSLTDLCGPATVRHALAAPALTAAVFDSLNVSAGTKRLIIRTRNSELWAGDVREFKTDYVAVTPDGAQWLVDHGIKVIGVDYLSVAIYADPITPHNILLKAGIIPLEGLNLSNIAEGNYTLYCLPLKLMGADGAPARTILVEAD
ncbi:MAG TPA: cyclase family protein [Anaerolineales bacterium]|nr:cyclase family protein [Anaerolineales bacterium]